MFDADRPILSSEQDRLNRSQFAKYLARSLLDHHDPESLVVGLYGGWGSGKTSVLNLVLEELNFAASNMLDEDKPIILYFSPWSYSGQDQLIYSFFRRLSSTLRNAPYFENSPRIIHLLELYVSFFTHTPIPKSLRSKRNFVEKITFQEKEEIYAWESGRDLTLVKAELNELLRQQKHKIIIMIDNISRIKHEEIKQIFQIVKSMGDYANTAYLLAFDKEQVVRAINRIDGSGGEELIEKVVQLPFEIPPILQQDIENILADRLNEIVATVPEDAWNIEYWADIYYSSLKYFFRNCRDITRYVNTLNFGYSRLRDVVNPVDYFALTAIEVFMPNVYAGIRDNKDLFTDLLDNVYQLTSDEIQKDKIRCNEILARDDRISRDLLLELLMRLFPRIRHIYYPDIAFYHSDSIARKLRRICSPDLFEVYFRLSLQPGHITESEFETILSLASDADAFDQALTRLNQDERISKFLDQLDSQTLQKIPEKNIPAIVNALFDNGDLFPQGIFGMLSLDTPMRIHRIIHGLLQRFKNMEERFNCLQNAIAKATKSIFIIVHELTEQGREHLENEDTFLPIEFRDIAPDQLNLLRKLATSRIAYWGQTERLIDHPRLLPILYAWKNWGSEEDCRRYVEKITHTDKGLVAFLRATLDEAITDAMVSYEKNPSWETYLQNIEDFIPAHLLENHAKILFEDNYFEKLREKEQLALMIFLDLVKANTIKIIPKTAP
ncbi:MAG: KAP family P-loop protein [uncultured bacterium]|nr:MAG: KAP family P-loop protein [uncultured bacterium]